MVRFTVLASGSRGNSTVVSAGRTRILIDAGLSCRELFRRLKLVGEDPASLDGIVITHEHQDHVGGVAVTARKLGIPVYFTEATHRAWMRWLAPRKQMTYAQWLEQTRKQREERETEAVAVEVEAEDAVEETLETVAASGSATSVKDDPTWLPAVEYFKPGEAFCIGDIDLEPFTIPHDAADPVGFVLKAEGLRLGYATDLGYIPPNVKSALMGVELLMLESNHDLEMLRDGPYPWAVKQRVLSRVGHLSNDATAEFLAEDYDGQAAWVILAHLSENNNHPDLARVAADRALQARPSLLANRLLIAGQYDPLESITF